MAKRRANGEGSIRKRKDGRWEGRYTAGRDPVTGKAIYKNVLGKTQAEVKAKLKDAIEKSSSLVTTNTVQLVPFPPAQQIHCRRNVALVVAEDLLFQGLWRQSAVKESGDLRPAVWMLSAHSDFIDKIHLVVHCPMPPLLVKQSQAGYDLL